MGISHTGAEFADRVSRSTVQTGVSSGFSAVQGADLGDSLLQGAINVAASTAAAFAANQLGQAYKTGEINTVLHKTFHAVLGAGLGAASNIKDPGKGALGGATAALAEAIMEQLPETLSLDTRVNISILSAASVALLTNQDVNAAGLASTNALQDNFCEPPLSKEELELQSEAIKSVAKAVTTEIPGCLSFRGDMHARVDDGFNFIQDYIQSLPFVETLQSFYENNPHAIRMLPLPVQGMIYSRSISKLGVDLIVPVTILDIGLNLTVAGKGLGMGAKSVVRGVSWGWSKGAQVLSNAGGRIGVMKTLASRGPRIIQDLEHLKFNPVIFDKTVTWTAPKGTQQTYKVFQRNDINWNMIRTEGDKRFVGKTNTDAARAGLAPQLNDGYLATLHHIGQDSRGAIVEASIRYHGVGKSGQNILHGQFGKNKPHPEFPINRKKFNQDTRDYWKTRGLNQ